MIISFAFAAALAAVAVAGCASRLPPARNGALPPISESEQSIKLMLSYDANSDGTLTRDELEAGLLRQYAEADLNHDGKLDLREMQAENDRRFRAFGTEASPLIDWNQDGVIDFTEFASTARSVFDEMDKNHDGKLDPAELRLPQQPRLGPPPAAAQRQGR